MHRNASGRFRSKMQDVFAEEEEEEKKKEGDDGDGDDAADANNDEAWHPFFSDLPLPSSFFSFRTSSLTYLLSSQSLFFLLLSFDHTSVGPSQPS